LKDFNTLYDEHSSELICHVSAIENINQSLISEEKEINRILTKKEERFEKIKKLSDAELCAVLLGYSLFLLVLSSDMS
jgi:uncharacterized membrane protein